MKPSTKALWRQAKIATRSGVNNIIVPFIRPILQGDDIKFGANKISDLIPKLDGALQLLISPRDQMAGTFRNVERLGNEIVQNGDFHNFTFDYPSIGEASPFYESDFSVDEDGWAADGGTEVANVDGIDGEDNVLKFWASGSNGLHRLHRANTLTPYPNQIFKVTGKVYIPSSNTNLKQVQIYTGYNQEGGTESISTTDTWVDFECEIEPTTYRYLIIEGDDGSGNQIFTGAGVDTDDIFYVKDVKVQRVGLVAHWVFDDYYHAQEGTGKTALQDLTANGHDLTASVGFDWQNQFDGDNPAYKGGNALRFDQVDDYFYIPAASADAFNPNGNSFSIAVWVNYTNIVEYAAFISKGYLLYTIDMQSTGIPRFVVNNQVLWFGSDPKNDGNWHLLVGVYDANAQTMYAYLDGVLVGSKTGVVPVTSNTSDFTIGKYSLANYYFNGYDSEPAYFNRALSATEVKALYSKAYGWDWDEVGDLQNDNFKQVISGGGTLTQDVTTLDNTLYKEQLVGEGVNNIDYFGETTSHTVTLTDGTWTSASVKEVTNVDEIPNFVEDFSKGGAEYGDELVTNGDMELNSNWTAKGTPTVCEQSAEQVYGGSYSWKVVTSANYDGINSDLIITETGKIYRIVAYIYPDESSVNNTYRVCLTQGSDGSYVEVFTTTDLVKGQWNKIEYYHRETVGGNSAFVSIYGNISQTFYIDNVSIVEVSNGNHGLAQGGLETGQPVHPYSWEFDGVDDVGVFQNCCAVETHPFILAGWFKTTVTSGTILARRSTTDSWYRININGSGLIQVELSYDYNNTTGNSHVVSLTSDHAVNDDNWHFFALVRDNNSDIWLYIDGVKQTQTVNFPENLDSFDANCEFTIGAWGTGIYYDFFQGKLGIIPPYLFDGQDGRPSSSPSNYKQVIKLIYERTKFIKYLEH